MKLTIVKVRKYRENLGQTADTLLSRQSGKDVLVKFLGR